MHLHAMPQCPPRPTASPKVPKSIANLFVISVFRAMTLSELEGWHRERLYIRRLFLAGGYRFRNSGFGTLWVTDVKRGKDVFDSCNARPTTSQNRRGREM